MKKFSDFNLLDFGNTIQIVGFVLRGNGETIVVPFPDEKMPDASFVASVNGKVESEKSFVDVLEMSTEDWSNFLYQSDVLNVELQYPKKAIVRKSQRQIDQNVAWAVFERDYYRCRYCGAKAPLSVDHVDLWEVGGASVQGNLISSCRRDNRQRGSMPYEEWLNSDYYRKCSEGLSESGKQWNLAIVEHLDYLKTLRVDRQRSR